MLRPLRIDTKIAATVLASVLAVYAGASTFGASACMRIPRLPLHESPASVGLVFQSVSFYSRVDRVELKGWFLPSGSDSVLLIVNGGFQNRVDPIADTLELSRDLVNRGYNILLFDLRGRGESQGEARSLTNMERDIGGAIDYLNSRGFPPCKIGIIGYCSGAASTCIFASKENVGGVVLDGCFTSVRSMVYNQASSRGIPPVLVIIFVPGVQLAATIFYGYQAVNPIDVVGKVRCPIFFIHEENDDLVPPQETTELFNESGNPSNIYWQIPDTLHNRGYETHPTEYVARVDAFFRIALMTVPSTN
jgi:dienelactone hydrolase